MTPTERAETTYDAGRCLKCAVGLNHTSRTCKKSVRCTVEGCDEPWHHISLFHGSTFKITKNSTGSGATTSTPTSAAVALSEEGAPTAACHSCLVTPAGVSAEKKTLFKIVPVRLVAGRKAFDTFAFLDSGSDTTFIRQDVAKTKFGLGDSQIKLLVKTYDGTAKEVDRDAVDFEISTRDGRKKFAVRRAYTVDKLKIAPNPPITELPIDS